MTILQKCASILAQYIIVVTGICCVGISLDYKITNLPLLSIDGNTVQWLDKLNGGCDKRTLLNENIILPHEDAVLHFLQGFGGIVFMLCAPIQLKFNKHPNITTVIISTIGTALGCGYQIYNISKRLDSNHAYGNYFAYSSYYSNLLDMLLGMLLGLLFMTFCYIIYGIVSLCLKHKQYISYSINYSFPSTVFLLVSFLITIETNVLLNKTKQSIYCDIQGVRYPCKDLCDLVTVCPVDMSPNMRLYRNICL